ncbi:MAG: AAA family ATPase [Candidatus Micrarchaeaceae archaeon]
MRSKVIGITGTPASGKSTFASALSNKLGIENVIELGEVVQKMHFYTSYDRHYRAYVADIAALEKYIRKKCEEKGDIVIVGHLLADLNIRVDAMVVVRARLESLLNRMLKRGYSIAKIRENIAAEITDYFGNASAAKGIPTIEVLSEEDKNRAIKELSDFIKGKGANLHSRGLSYNRGSEFEKFIKGHPELGL